MSRNTTLKAKDKQKGSLRNIKAHKISQQIQQLLSIDPHLHPLADKENVTDNLTPFTDQQQLAKSSTLADLKSKRKEESVGEEEESRGEIVRL